MYVDGRADGANDGSSWADAYVHLQDATAAAAGGGISEIRVAQGVYRPDRDSANPNGTGNREASFDLLNGVTLQGGYAGFGAADPDARDIELFGTVLSGDLAGDDVLLTSNAECVAAGGTWHDVLCSKIENNDENSYHVVVSLSNDETAILDGFTVSDGNGNGPALGATPDSKDQGSGVNVYFGTPMLTRCKFENNRTDNHGAVNDHGGVTLTDCEFRSNFAIRWGGGLHNQSGLTTTVTGCVFEKNATAGTGGGGGAVFSRGNLSMNGCDLLDNRSAAKAGAIYLDQNAAADLTDCTVGRNQSADHGGAVYTEAFADLTLTRVSFDRNSTVEPLKNGGALYNFIAFNVTITDCSFDGNQADRGGAIYNDGSLNYTVIDTMFMDNVVPNQGAAVYNGASDATFTDCLFAGNSAPDPSGSVPGMAGDGAGMYNYLSDAVITRCTFHSNSADRYGGAIANLDSSPVIVDSTFVGNTGLRNGGAIWIQFVSNVTLTGSLFARNDTIRGGGAVYLQTDSALSVDRCRFVQNTARNGAAIRVALSQVFISNSLFVGNVAEDLGGALNTSGTDSPVTNCTFFANSAGVGGGVWGAGSSPLTNCVFWNNSDADGMGEGGQISGNMIVNNCCVQGWTGTRFDGVGNFEADPEFVDPAGADGLIGTGDDNLRLLIGSPVINVGDNAAIIGSADLDGNPRVANGTVDLGAFEAAETCPNGTCDPQESPCVCPQDCGPPPAVETACGDNEDGDCDELVDCLDPDCASACSGNEIPTVSEWGLAILLAMLLAAGVIVFAKLQPPMRS